MLLSNQIAGVFVHYYLWKFSASFFDFLHRDSNLRMVLYEIIFLVGFVQSCPATRELVLTYQGSLLLIFVAAPDENNSDQNIVHF